MCLRSKEGTATLHIQGAVNFFAFRVFGIMVCSAIWPESSQQGQNFHLTIVSINWCGGNNKSSIIDDEILNLRSNAGNAQFEHVCRHILRSCRRQLFTAYSLSNGKFITLCRGPQPWQLPPHQKIGMYIMNINLIILS
jgi:hypothetical protein